MEIFYIESRMNCCTLFTRLNCSTASSDVMPVFSGSRLSGWSRRAKNLYRTFISRPVTPPTPPSRSSSPPRQTQPSPSPRRNRRNYENNIESQLTDSLRILGLESGVTGREINVRYIFLARRLHPDKHDPEITGMTSEEAVEQFKRVNNAQQFIRD